MFNSLTPWNAARQASLSIANSQSLLNLISIESMVPSNHLIFCRPLLLLPLIFPSVRVFANESTLRNRWPKNWSSASVLPMNIQHWFPLGPTGWFSLLSKELSRIFSNTTFQKHQFFGAQLSFCPTLIAIHDYWKNHSLTRWTFVGRVMSLLYKTLSRSDIAFRPRSKSLLILWLQLPSAVILEPLPKKVCHCFHCFPIYLPWSDGTGWHDLHFLNAQF